MGIWSAHKVWPGFLPFIIRDIFMSQIFFRTMLQWHVGPRHVHVGINTIWDWDRSKPMEKLTSNRKSHLLHVFWSFDQMGLTAAIIGGDVLGKYQLSKSRLFKYNSTCYQKISLARICIYLGWRKIKMRHLIIYLKWYHNGISVWAKF